MCISICFITRKWTNFWPEYYSIFASIFTSRSNTPTSNHHIFASSTIRLRLQRFAIHFNNESRSGTPLRRNLLCYCKHLRHWLFLSLETRPDEKIFFYETETRLLSTSTVAQEKTENLVKNLRRDETNRSKLSNIWTSTDIQDFS